MRCGHVPSAGDSDEALFRVAFTKDELLAVSEAIDGAIGNIEGRGAVNDGRPMHSALVRARWRVNDYFSNRMDEYMREAKK